MEKKPRAHAELIKQWADGAEVEYRQKVSGNWTPTTAPAFVEDYEYRVKVERRYPDTIMTCPEMYRAYSGEANLTENERFINLINAGLRHAIDNGQVVTREEFKRLSDELGRAVCSLNAYGYTDEGGDLWKPPLGNGYPRARVIAEHVAIAVETETRNAMCAGRTCKYSLDEILAKISN